MADRPTDLEPLSEPGPPEGQLLIYRDGTTSLQVRLAGRSVWLLQRLIAELYRVSLKTVNEHLVNIYAEGEVGREATIRTFRIVRRVEWGKMFVDAVWRRLRSMWR